MMRRFYSGKYRSAFGELICRLRFPSRKYYGGADVLAVSPRSRA